MTAKDAINDVLTKMEHGEIFPLRFNIEKGFNELPPDNGCRRFEPSGEETLTVTYRKLKEWNERN